MPISALTHSQGNNSANGWCSGARHASQDGGWSCAMVSSASGHAYGPTVSWSKQPSVLLTVRSHSIPGLANSRDLQHTHAAASALPHPHCRIGTAASALPHLRSKVQHTWGILSGGCVQPEHQKLEYGGSVDHGHANLHVMVLGGPYA